MSGKKKEWSIREDMDVWCLCMHVMTLDFCCASLFSPQVHYHKSIEYRFTHNHMSWMTCGEGRWASGLYSFQSLVVFIV